MSTRIKICGVTRPDDANTAARFGADAIGMVFVASSPRCIDAACAGEIVAALPRETLRVGLFLDPARDAVEAVLRDVALDVLQFHGREPAKFCRSFGLPYIKTLGLANATADDVKMFVEEYDDAAWLLFDSHAHGEAGGTGKTANWSTLPSTSNKVMLAGGLAPENVFDAVRLVQPFGVDVSSGVEAQAGVKDPVKIERFINEVRRADAATS
ncbi:MAG TPA: phosphoribosylanthranilate isomerase [Gammaproteobacteria bacterium]